MRTKLVAVSAGTTTGIVTQAECPAKVAIANSGAGTGANGIVYVSNEGNAFASGAGIPLGLNGLMVWGKTTDPLFAFCIGEPTEILVTFIDQNDEISL